MRGAGQTEKHILVMADSDKTDHVKNMFEPDINDEQEMPADYDAGILFLAGQNLVAAYNDDSPVAYTNIENSLDIICQFMHENVDFLDAERPAEQVLEICRTISETGSLFAYLEYIIMYVESPKAIANALYALNMFCGVSGSDEMMVEICEDEFIRKLIDISMNPELCVPERTRLFSLPEATLSMCMGGVWHLPKEQYDVIQVRSLELLCELTPRSYDTRMQLLRGALNEMMFSIMVPVKTRDEVLSATGEELTMVMTTPTASSDATTVLMTLIMAVLENTDEIWSETTGPYAKFFLDHLHIDDRIDMLCVQGIYICCDKDITLVDEIISHEKMHLIGELLGSKYPPIVHEAMAFTQLLMCNASQPSREAFASMINWRNWGIHGWAASADEEHEKLTFDFIDVSGRILDNNWGWLYQTFVDNGIIEVMLFCAKDGSFKIRKKAALVLVSLLDRIDNSVVLRLMETGLVEFLANFAEQLDDHWLIQILNALIYMMSGVFTPDQVRLLFEELEEFGLDDTIETLMDTDNEDLFNKTQQYMETRERVEEMLAALQAETP